MSEYTTNRAINTTVGGMPMHVDMAPPSFILRDGGKEWLCEWHGYCGPTLLDKRTGQPAKNQPAANDRWWVAILAWHAQGAHVVDGFGVWTEPVKVKRKWRRLCKGHYINVPDDASGPDIVEFDEPA
jgi:hypothetical protein